MKRIGILSDTHSYGDEKYLHYFEPCDAIWHAGAIGRMLALDFQAKYYDRELLNLAEKESGLSEKIFEENDEKKGFFRGLLNIAALCDV